MWQEDTLGPRPVDLARSALDVRASKERHDRSPRNLIDGDPATYWHAQSGDGESPWIEVEWAGPQTFCQLVVRLRWGMPTRLVAQAWNGREWETFASASGDAPELQYYSPLLTFPAVTTSKIRICEIEGDFMAIAVEVYPEPTPPVVRVGADLLGGMTGVVAESLGIRPIAGAAVRVAGSGKAGDWEATTQSDDRGLFFLSMPVGLRGPLTVTAQAPSGTAVCVIAAEDLPLELTPMAQDAQEPALAISLNGTWSFMTDPDEGFWKPGYDDDDWAGIAVPAHWEFEGFKCASGIGGYRRWLVIPPEWRGRRVKLGFDGVYSRAEVWMNGVRVGAHEGGATPFVLDATEAVKFGRENLIAVRVEEYTAAQTLDQMSGYADFHLAGIYRPARLFSVPAVHFARFHAEAQLDSQYSDGVLRVYVGLANESDRETKRARVRLELRDPNGALIQLSPSTMDGALEAWSRTDRAIEVPVKSPLHWEAEHPNLYTLSAVLVQGGREIERVTRRIGFRTVEIRGKQFLINGVQVKLAGACHHDTHPLLGRSVTPDITRRDLELMKGCNLNSVRTSHYPPVPWLPDMADEIGLFVEDEGPFCWADNSKNVLLTPLVLQHEAELFERDRSHPSVVWWSVCNESRWGIAFENAYQWMRRQDSTRPFGAATSKDLDIATRHNPSSVDRLVAAEACETPLNFDESFCIWQGIYRDSLEQWLDPGMRDYWVLPQIDVWAHIIKSPTIFGHMIWAWADDMFAIPGYGVEIGRAYALQARNFNNEIYKLPGRGICGDAPWGVIDGWQRPKPEWWLCKKIHTPIRIADKQVIPVPAAGQPLEVPVFNGYYYTDLSELRIQWTIGSESGSVTARLAPQQAGTIAIRPTRAFVAGDVLDLRFHDAKGELIDAYRLPIGETPQEEVEPALLLGDFAVVEDNLLSGATLRFVAPGFEAAFAKETGVLKRAVGIVGPALSYTPLLHILPSSHYWDAVPNPLTWHKQAMTWEQQAGEVRVHVEGTYEGFEGSYDYLISPDGAIEIGYSFTNTGPEFRAKEIGVKLSLPTECQQLSWRRNAEYSVYPADHIGRPEGSAVAFADHGAALPPSWPWPQDNTPLGSNDFRSTKRNIVWASLTDELGCGVVVEGLDVSGGSAARTAGARMAEVDQQTHETLEPSGGQHVRACMEGDRAALYVLDWYGGTRCSAGEWTSNYGRGKTVATGDVLSGRIRFRVN